MNLNKWCYFLTALSVCRSVEFVVSDSKNSSLFHGVLFNVNTTFNGRPVFRYDNPSVPLYLYGYIPSSSALVCPEESGGPSSTTLWAVGRTLGDSLPSMYFNHTSETGPKHQHDIVSLVDRIGWTVYDTATSSFHVDPSVMLKCYRIW